MAAVRQHLKASGRLLRTIEHHVAACEEIWWNLRRADADRQVRNFTGAEQLECRAVVLVVAHRDDAPGTHLVQEHGNRRAPAAKARIALAPLAAPGGQQ